MDDKQYRSKSLKEITGDNLATGNKVLSEAYSKPMLLILTSFIWLEVDDLGNTSPFAPWVEAILTNFGICLYPTPAKSILISLKGPLAVGEFVEYLKVSVVEES